VQPDQNKIILCIICEHFPFCLLESIRSLINA
jgi:hypothetical protein